MYELEMLDIEVDELVAQLKKEYIHYGTNSTAFSYVKDLDENYMCNCPFHKEARPSFGISKSYPYTYNCFMCGERGTLISLVSHCLGKDELQATSWLLKSYRLFYSENVKLDINKLFPNNSRNKPVLDPLIMNAYSPLPHPWLLQRGFSPEVVQKFSLRYDSNLNAIVFPIWDSKGNIRYIKTRLINPTIKGSKYLNVEGVHKRDIVYLIHYIKQAGIREIFITEGEFNALSLYQVGLPAVSIGSSKITDEQVNILKKTGIQKVHLFLDNDEAGRTGVIKAYNKLSPYMLVDQVVFPKMFNDANDMLKVNALVPSNVSIQLCKQFKLKNF